MKNKSIKHIVCSFTGFKGISYDKRKKRYKVMVGKKMKGYFLDLKEAIYQRLIEENKIWGYNNDFNNESLINNYYKLAVKTSELYIKNKNKINELKLKNEKEEKELLKKEENKKNKKINYFKKRGI